MPAEIIQDTKDGAVLTIRVQPRAARTDYVGIQGMALKFRVAAPPVEGAANDELCRYLAQRFGLPKKQVVVCSGQAVRHKRVLLKRVLSTQVRDVLNIPP